METKNKQLGKIGYTVSSLGGLLVIFNLTIFKDSEWGLWLAILAVLIILLGLYLSKKAKENEQE